MRRSLRFTSVQGMSPHARDVTAAVRTTLRANGAAAEGRLRVVPTPESLALRTGERSSQMISRG
jgi:hypothetical protein